MGSKLPHSWSLYPSCHLNERVVIVQRVHEVRLGGKRDARVSSLVAVRECAEGAQVTRAFIVRPFDEKDVPGVGKVDFNWIDRELISPALEKLEIHGRTTAEILQQGNIQGDIFNRLLCAQVVIADVSIANANVFYELGIRHALRDRFTCLIKFQVPGQGPLFDIAAERCLVYDVKYPSASVDELARRIDVTINADRSDSPVFHFVQDLPSLSSSRLVTVPQEFLEDVEAAEKYGHLGILCAFAAELRELDLPWASAGLVHIAEALFAQRAWNVARELWEVVREENPQDPLANGRLAAIYQKQPQPDLVASDQAIERALVGAEGETLADLRALRASNNKTRWIQQWQDIVDVEERRCVALDAPYWQEAFDGYREAFVGHLNHYYSGINALTLATIRVALAQALPEPWSCRCSSHEEANQKLQSAQRELSLLATAVRVSISAALARNDSWAAITNADYECLNSDRVAYVLGLYRAALKDSSHQSRGAVRRQLAVLKDLDVVSANASAAIEVIDGFGRSKSVTEVPAMVLAFAGHRLDASGRKPERFPARAEAQARAMIHHKIVELKTQVSGNVIGYAGCASGGDILFHEVCEELGVPTEVFLAGPRAPYLEASVQDGGADWVRRFDVIQLRHAGRINQLTPDLDLPRWLRSVEDFGIWQHNNLWLLHSALAHGAEKVVLIALWNGMRGGGPGGTEHMVTEVKRLGGRCEVLDAKLLLA